MNHYSEQSERNVLSCALNHPGQSLPFCIENGLTPEFFSLNHHAIIYGKIVETYISGGDGGVVAIAQAIEAAGRLKEIGGFVMLSELSSLSGIPSLIPSSISEIRKKYQERRLHQLLEGQLQELSNPASDVLSVLNTMTAEADIISNLGQARKITAIKDQVMDSVNQIYERVKGEASAGIKTTIPTLDALTGGMKMGNYWVVAGPEKGGKSAFAMNLVYAFIEAGHRVIFFGLEMPAGENVERLFSRIGTIDGTRMRDGLLSDHELTKLANAASTLASSKLTLCDDCFDLSQIISRTKMMKNLNPDLSAVFLDYVQLAEAGLTSEKSREQEVARVSRSMRRISAECNVFVCALSQLNDDGRMRESRSLGMDATAILKIEMTGVADHRLLSVVQRGGKSGVKVSLNYSGEYCRFTESTENFEEQKHDEKKPFKNHPKSKFRH